MSVSTETAAPSLLSSPRAATTRGGRSFPRRLFAMLEEAESKGFDDIVAWLPDGKSFKVLKPKKFAATIMHQYFKNQTKYKSFQRQLNIYGFQRIFLGPNKGGYEHQFLDRNQPDLCRRITRQQVPERSQEGDPAYASAAQTHLSTPKPFSLPTATPTVDDSVRGNAFAAASALFEKAQSATAGNTFSGVSAGQQNNNATTGNRFQAKPSHCNNNVEILDPAAEAELFSDLFGDIAPVGNDTSDFSFIAFSQIGGSSSDNPLEPNPVVRLSPSRETTTDSDDDTFFGLSFDDDIMAENEQQTRSAPGASSEHFFPWKLHRMLEDAKKNDFENIVSWVQGGAAFKVHDGEQFVEKIMPNYFDQTKYESFRRQLNLYGFSRVSRGPNRGIYFHEFFLESDRNLCQNIARARVGVTRPSCM